MESVFTGWGPFAYLGVLFVPIVVGLLTRCSWPGWLKFALSVGFCIVIGAITVLLTTGRWEWSAPFILSLIGAAETFYNAVIKPSGLAGWLATKWVKDPPTTPSVLVSE